MISSPIGEVAAWLAVRILANRKNGVHLRYGGTLRILKRMILSALRKKRPG